MITEVNLPPEVAYVTFAAQPNPVHDVQKFFADNVIPNKITLGMYEGELETSFTIPAGDLQKVLASGLLDKQASVMLLTDINGQGFRKASLLFLSDGAVSDYEMLKPIPRDEVQRHKSWTYDSAYSTYFGTFPIEAAKDELVA